VSVVSDAQALQRVIQRAMRRRRARRELEAALQARPELPNGRYQVVIYFPDKMVNLYQIRQWYVPMRQLAEKHSVAVISRSIATTATLLDECPLPVFYGPTIGDIENFVAHQPIKVAFYVNQNMRNFQMMRFPGMFHIFVSHGESDKIYMASNQAKSYDYCFVAGDAAVERIKSRLLDFDAERRLIRIGRPQVDVSEPGPELPADGRTVVLYAPTWEGDRPSMTYGSVASHGANLVRALVQTGRHRVIYRPHPRTGVFDQTFGEASRKIADLLVAANHRDPGAGHLLDTESTFGWHLQAADVCICDISAVAFDWLATSKPLLLTRPAAAHAEVDPSGIAGYVPLLAAADSASVESLIAVAAENRLSEKYRKLTYHYFGDTTAGASMQRFLAACDQVIELRDKAAAQIPTVIDLAALERAQSGTMPESHVPRAHMSLMGDEDREEGLDS
jgi:hypothetical protein